MSRELLEKLQCLYENLMLNNFRKNGCSEKNNYELYTKATQQWILPTNFGGNNNYCHQNLLCLNFSRCLF